MQPKIGTVGWIDLTVVDAPAIRDFYSRVVGWVTSEVPMGTYADYCVHPAEGEPPVAGLCHARGENASIPPVWLIYIVVADLAESLNTCREMGGEVVNGPRSLPGAKFAIIRDPAGCACGLYQAD